MSALETILRDEIARTGPLPLARFMDLALHHPEHGYYQQDARRIGRQGDFFTSVSVGPLFAELLAFQFDRWRREAGARRLRLIEAGAHDGRLACDLLRWFQRQRPELLPHLQFVLLEPSIRHRNWQAETLAGFAESISWVDAPGALPAPAEDETAVLFANEFLDAFPVHRLAWDAAQRSWFEWGVAFEGDRLVWQRLPAGEEIVRALPRWLGDGKPWTTEDLAVLGEMLPDGFVFEFSPAAEAWWRAAANALPHGWLVTFDYGFAPGESIRPERLHGTLRAYSGHHVSDDLLARPGEQDLTAHVHFPVLEAAAKQSGWHTAEFCTQERFLSRIALDTMPARSSFGVWDDARARQFRTLVHPGQLGAAFRVLVQAK